MRVSLSVLTAAGLLTSSMAVAQCVRLAEMTALDVAGLKTTLMVAALNCSANAKYNAFVMKFRPELADQDKVLGSYFSRIHGGQGRTRQDNYATQLANSRSQAGIRQGMAHCAQNMPIFDEVLALHNSSELRDYAAGKSVEQPIPVVRCGSTPIQKAVSAPTKRTRKRT